MVSVLFYGINVVNLLQYHCQQKCYIIEEISFDMTMIYISIYDTGSSVKGYCKKNRMGKARMRVVV